MSPTGLSPAWRTAAATAAGYVALLLVLFALVFVAPYLVFTAL